MNEVRFHFESVTSSGFAVGEVWRAFANASFERRHFTAYYGPGGAPLKLRLREGDYWVRLKLPYGSMLQELVNVPKQDTPIDVTLRVPPPARGGSSHTSQFSAMPPLLDIEVKSASILVTASRKPSARRDTPVLPNTARDRTIDRAAVNDQRAQFFVNFPREGQRSDGLPSQGSSRRKFSLSLVQASFFKWPRVPHSFSLASKKNKDFLFQRPFLEPHAYFNVALRYATGAEPVPVSVDGSSINSTIRERDVELLRTDREIADRKYRRSLMVVSDAAKRPEIIVAIPDGRRGGAGTLRIYQGPKNTSKKLRASVEIDNPKFSALLQYMKGNDLSAAMQIVDDSVEILYAKFDNPFAAAAAGYVLIQAAPAKLHVPWHIWIGNLGRYFDNLPDGEILHATLLLQRGDATSESGWGNAEEYFPRERAARARLAAQLVLSAINKGPPLFRAGLSLLDSNIRILRSLDLPKDINVELIEAGRLVTWLSMRIDPIEPFSVFYLKV